MKITWNTRFDIVTLINRIIKAGENPADIIPHPDFDRPVCEYIFDRRSTTDESRSDYFNCSSYTVYVDQLLFYKQLRASLSKKESYSLNAISKEELKDSKLDYSDLGSIQTLPYDDYKLFVKYNIKDVILCAKLEEKNKDITLFYTLADMTRTRLFKAMKKTTSIKNMANKFFFDQGYRMGNNLNASYGVDKIAAESFEGALVADSNRNMSVGKKLFNKFSKYIFDLVIDFDLSSLYPSIMRAFNIDASTQYGRIIIKSDNNIPMTDKNIYVPKEVLHDIESNRNLGAEFVDDMNTNDSNFIARKWFNLPSTEDNIRELAKLIKSKKGK